MGLGQEDKNCERGSGGQEGVMVEEEIEKGGVREDVLSCLCQTLMLHTLEGRDHGWKIRWRGKGECFMLCIPSICVPAVSFDAVVIGRCLERDAVILY